MCNFCGVKRPLTNNLQTCDGGGVSTAGQAQQNNKRKEEEEESVIGLDSKLRHDLNLRDTNGQIPVSFECRLEEPKCIEW